MSSPSVCHTATIGTVSAVACVCVRVRRCMGGGPHALRSYDAEGAVPRRPAHQGRHCCGWREWRHDSELRPAHSVARAVRASAPWFPASAPHCETLCVCACALTSGATKPASRPCACHRRAPYTGAPTHRHDTCAPTGAANRRIKTLALARRPTCAMWGSCALCAQPWFAVPARNTCATHHAHCGTIGREG